jgi:hypothetical protein
MIRRRRWSLTAAAVVIVAVVIGDVTYERRADADCATVRALNEVADRFTGRIADDVNHPTQAARADYTPALERFSAQAARLRDSGLARRARDVAALAGQTVALIPRIRDDKLRAPRGDPSPTGAQQDFVRDQRAIQ